MVSNTQKILNRWAEEQKNKKTGKGIICPYCEREQDHETMYNYVSYWGEDTQGELQCEDCEKTFYVEEKVEREFETTTMEWVKKEQARFDKLLKGKSK